MFGFIGQFGIWGIVVVAVLVLVLFGTRGQIPAFMRDIGRGITSFRSGLKEGADDAKKGTEAIDETKAETVETTAEEKQKDA